MIRTLHQILEKCTYGSEHDFMESWRVSILRNFSGLQRDSCNFPCEFMAFCEKNREWANTEREAVRSMVNDNLRFGHAARHLMLICRNAAFEEPAIDLIRVAATDRPITIFVGSKFLADQASATEKVNIFNFKMICIYCMLPPLKSEQ